MIKACIFDLDGVIVDTAKYHYIAWKEIANELGFEFSETHNEKLKGVSRMKSLDIMLAVGGINLNREQKEVLAAKKNEIYLKYILNMGSEEILPGAMELLLELRKKGISTALGSASKNAVTILEKLNLTNLFDTIIDGNKTTKAKPDPEVFLKAASELKVNPNDCIVFEDAPAGVEAALAAGMKCIGIGSIENLPNAHMVVGGLNQIKLETLSKLQ